MSLTRIGSIGINTGIAFAGVTTIVTLNTANDALSIGATVNVGSGITLGASGDIFATGVSTVTTLKVGSGVTVSSDGDVFFTGIATGNGSGLTAINASNIGSGTVPTARLGSGTASSSTFLRGDSTFQTVVTDLVNDTSPQLGGTLDVNGQYISFPDSNGTTNQARFGTGDDLKIYHQSNSSYILNTTGNLNIGSNNEVRIKGGNDAGENCAIFKDNGAVELYHDNSKKFETTSNGATVTGTLSAGAADLGTGDLTLTGNINLADSSGGGNNRIIFGASDDFQLWHDGSHSYIADEGTGNLRVLTNSFTVNNAANSENMIQATEDGAVTLYYDAEPQAETASGSFRIRGKSYLSQQAGAMDSLVNMRVSFYQQIAASGSYTFQAGSAYAMGTVTVHGSRGPGANNATIATGKVYLIHIRAGATAGLGAQVGSDIGGASGGFSYGIAAASQGITVTNNSSTYAMKTYVTFDLTGFV